MEGVSIWHWLVVLVGVYAISGIPIARILRRTGRSAWWSLLIFVPLANLIGLWVFAFMPWPALGERYSTN
jgi:hypothetical protein